MLHIKPNLLANTWSTLKNCTNTKHFSFWAKFLKDFTTRLLLSYSILAYMTAYITLSMSILPTPIMTNHTLLESNVSFYTLLLSFYIIINIISAPSANLTYCTFYMAIEVLWRWYDVYMLHVFSPLQSSQLDGCLWEEECFNVIKSDEQIAGQMAIWYCSTP